MARRGSDGERVEPRTGLGRWLSTRDIIVIAALCVICLVFVVMAFLDNQKGLDDSRNRKKEVERMVQDFERNRDAER